MPKKLKSILLFGSIYSNRAVGKFIQLTVLLEYIDLCCYTSLFVPHTTIHVFYLYTKSAVGDTN